MAPPPPSSEPALPADPNAVATMAAKADRWWRDLPLTERLHIITTHKARTARGPQAPI